MADRLRRQIPNDSPVLVLVFGIAAFLFGAGFSVPIFIGGHQPALAGVPVIIAVAGAACVVYAVVRLLRRRRS